MNDSAPPLELSLLGTLTPPLESVDLGMLWKARRQVKTMTLTCAHRQSSRRWITTTGILAVEENQDSAEFMLEDVKSCFVLLEFSEHCLNERILATELPLS